MSVIVLDAIALSGNCRVKVSGQDHLLGERTATKWSPKTHACLRCPDQATGRTRWSKQPSSREPQVGKSSMREISSCSASKLVSHLPGQWVSEQWG